MFPEHTTARELIQDRIRRVETQIGYDDKNLDRALQTYEEAAEAYDTRKRELLVSRGRSVAELEELKTALKLLSELHK